MSTGAPLTLITGASSGIGRDAAVRLSKDRRLILHGRDRARLQETVSMCAESSAHLIWPYDLREVENLGTSLTNLLQGSSAGVEAFVHAAGSVKALPLRSVNYQVAMEMMNVNFFSAMEIVSLLVRQKINGSNLRSVVLISSIWSTFGAKGHSVYCASKAAADGLVRALAVELAPTVRVNSILPGAIRTSMAEGAFDDPAIVAKLKQDYPLGIGCPQDVSEAIEFLLSNKSRWITGQQLVVDGGRTVNMSLT